MNQEDYMRYIKAFNARDYDGVASFFADDFALENAGFKVEGKKAFREFYHFFHEYCHEEILFKGFYAGERDFVANVVIRFTGLKDLSPEVLQAKGYPGITPVGMGASVEVEFLFLYVLNDEGLIQHIKGAVWIPASPNP